MDVVRIFDTTLRDGEQSPGFSMNTDEKIRMARQLAALNVDVIEAGFPIASLWRRRARTTIMWARGPIRAACGMRASVATTFRRCALPR